MLGVGASYPSLQSSPVLPHHSQFHSISLRIHLTLTGLLVQATALSLVSLSAITRDSHLGFRPKKRMGFSAWFTWSAPRSPCLVVIGNDGTIL